MNTALEISKRLAMAPVIPLVQANDPQVAVQTARALIAGGLTVIEVVLRTTEAVACMSAIGREVPEAIVGAGTVLNVEQVHASHKAGARFIVSPGLHEPAVRACQEFDLPVYPGVATASEVQQAWNLGLRTVKFFPASLAGGPAMIKAIGSAFGDMKFVPTGGISADNLASYLALPNVLACGGSWLTPAAAIANGDFDTVTCLALEAVAASKKD